MYWVYDISSLNFALFTLAAFVAFGVLGLLATRWYMGRRTRNVLQSNDIVGFYFGAIVGFYGITLGLISVGVWQTFSDADNKSTLEAAAIESLYRDVSSYPEPTRTAAATALKDYTKNVIEVAWPMQRLGQTPKGGSERMTELQKAMFPFEPQTQGQMAIHQEALRQYNRLSELRRLRDGVATHWVCHRRVSVSSLRPIQSDSCSARSGCPIAFPFLAPALRLLQLPQVLAQALGLRPRDRFLLLLPLFHVFAWTTNVLVPMCVGAVVVMAESIRPPKPWLKLMWKERITCFTAMPQIYAVLADQAKGFKKFVLRFVGQ